MRAAPKRTSTGINVSISGQSMAAIANAVSSSIYGANSEVGGAHGVEPLHFFVAKCAKSGGPYLFALPKRRDGTLDPGPMAITVPEGEVETERLSLGTLIGVGHSDYRTLVTTRTRFVQIEPLLEAAPFKAQEAAHRYWSNDPFFAKFEDVRRSEYSDFMASVPKQMRAAINAPFEDAGTVYQALDGFNRIGTQELTRIVHDAVQAHGRRMPREEGETFPRWEWRSQAEVNRENLISRANGIGTPYV